MKSRLLIALLVVMHGAHAVRADDEDKDLRPWLCDATPRVLDQIRELHGVLVASRKFCRTAGPSTPIKANAKR